jgi:hypothetical protein
VKGSGTGTSPQQRLTVLDVRQEVSKKRPDPWRLLWVPGGIKSEHRQEGGELLQGQQGVLEQFGADAISGQGGHGV